MLPQFQSIASQMGQSAETLSLAVSPSLNAHSHHARNEQQDEQQNHKAETTDYVQAFRRVCDWQQRCRLR
jgi:hypothetical protein